MICRSADEAFQAGLTEPCEHDKPPTQCADCQLTEAEMTRLLVLHRDHHHLGEAPTVAPLRAA